MVFSTLISKASAKLGVPSGGVYYPALKALAEYEKQALKVVESGEETNDKMLQYVITEAVATGRLSAPGFFADPVIRRAYLGTNERT